MKLFAPVVISAFALIAPAFAAELEGRSPHHHGQVAQAAGATVTVHDTVVSTAVQTVTVTVGQDQAQCSQAVDAIETSSVAQNQNQNQNHNQNHQQQQHHTTTVRAAHAVTETITSTRTFTTAVVHTTPVVVTETVQNNVHVHTVTKTIMDHVRQTELVTVTQTKTVEETDVVTETQTANDAENTSTSTADAGIADVNTNVVTVTDVETSTFLFTTTVDGNAAVETGTTTLTSDTSTSTSTSTDVGGNIADVTTSDAATSTSTAADSNSTDDPSTSLTLDPRSIEHGFEQDGQETPTAGQVASLTSSNNFINFCLTQNVPLTDGKQIRTGSCNVVPQGFIIAKDKLPSAKFVFPVNFSKIPANQAFTAKLKINNLQAGAFTNANTNYYAAPAQVNGQGILIGHSHLVIEQINGLDDTEPADPTKFAFFKGLNLPLDGDGTVSAALANGLPAGTYRMFSINTAANHQPALGSIAQHGSFDDGVYFTAE